MNRRSFLLGSGSLLAAPSIVRVTSLMSVSTVPFRPIVMGLDVASAPDWTAVAWYLDRRLSGLIVRRLDYLEAVLPSLPDAARSIS